MKRERMKGFATGFLAAALMMGLGVSALAATRSIQVEDGISVTINGAAFTPRDSKGNAVELFVHNGTTYAPLRAICEAAGLQVDYNSSTRTAQITTPEVALTAHPDSGSYITEAKAKEIALNHAGVNAADAVFFKVRLDWDDGRTEYEVEFYSGNTEYDYDIDAITGAIRSYDYDCDNYNINYQGVNSGASQTAGIDGLISAQRAQEIALAQTPSGTTVVKCSLDRDDGRYVYEIELRNGFTEYECEINAATGTILEWDVDYD